MFVLFKSYNALYFIAEGTIIQETKLSKNGIIFGHFRKHHEKMFH